MTEATGGSERRGGRAARRLLRSAPQPRAARPVRGGLEGGRYKPLDTTDIRRIHDAALTLLEEVGLSDPIASCADLITKAGQGSSDCRIE